jgi:hypothetical protein
MDITHVSSLRVGEWPAAIDIRRDAEHGNHVMIGSVHCFGARVQVLRKDEEIAIAVYQYDDEPLPEWWQDSELLWEFKP